MSGGQITTASGEYNNPAAILNVRGADGAQGRAYAFAGEAMARAPMLNKAVGGYHFKLTSFEKVPDAHVLSIQKDPGATVFYIGSMMLIATLVAVFFFSHQRVWAVIEERGAGKFIAILGGNTNRNAVAFGDRFKRLVAAVSGETATQADASEVQT
jgi:cytochrome c biogenesis protein